MMVIKAGRFLVSAGGPGDGSGSPGDTGAVGPTAAFFLCRVINPAKMDPMIPIMMLTHGTNTNSVEDRSGRKTTKMTYRMVPGCAPAMNPRIQGRAALKI